MQVKDWNGFVLGITLVLCGLAILGMAGSLAMSDNTQYEYTVKAEQVQQGEHVNITESYNSLGEAERQLLHEAFKKSDHFLGGARVELSTDEPVPNLTSGWKVISVEGVPLLVSIVGPEERDRTMGAVAFLSPIGIGILFIGAVAARSALS